MGRLICWLPRGGAAALRGRATELMGDVIIVLLSMGETAAQMQRDREAEGEIERQTERQRTAEETEMQEGERDRQTWLVANHQESIGYMTLSYFTFKCIILLSA